MCPIEREQDGLAMSSRNIHLSPEDREHALVLSRTLNWVKQHFADHSLAELKSLAEAEINKVTGVELAYFDLADGKTLHEATAQTTDIVALVAAKVGNTRLIDNMIITG